MAKKQDAMDKFLNDKEEYAFHKRYVINWLQTRIQCMTKQREAEEIGEELDYLARRICEVQDQLTGAVMSYDLAE